MPKLKSNGRSTAPPLPGAGEFSSSAHSDFDATVLFVDIECGFGRKKKDDSVVLELLLETEEIGSNIPVPDKRECSNEHWASLKKKKRFTCLEENMPYFFSGFFQPRMQNGQLGSSQTAAQQKMFGTRAILSPWVAITRKLPKNLSIERRTTSRMFSQTQQRRAYLGVHQGAEVKTTTLRRGVYIKRVFSSKKDAPPELPKEPPKPTKGNPKNPTKTSTITTEKSSTSAAPLEAEADTVASTTTGLTPNALKASVESAVAEFQLNASRLSTERKRNILALSFATLTITSVFFGKKIYDSGKESVAEITGEVISHEHMQIKTSELAAAVVKHVLNDENVMKKASHFLKSAADNPETQVQLD